MLHQSRRDQLTLEPLLPFIDREITADPERRDPARRTARRQDVAQATLYFKNLRAEKEEKKDRDLRARLNGVASRTHIPSHRIKQPAARPAIKADASTRRVHSDRSDERRKELTHRTPLTPITNPNSTDATSARPPVGRSSLSTTTRPTTAVGPTTTVTASKGIPISADRRTSDVRRAGVSTSASQATLVAVPEQSNVGKSESNSLDIFDAITEDLSGGAGPSSGRVRIVKPTQPHSQQSEQAARAPTSGATASHSPIPSTVAVTHGQGRLEPHPGASTLAAKNDARMCSISQHRGRTPICGLLHRRDFEVNRICRKLLVDQKIVFVVSWKSTWVPLKLVVEGNSSEYPYVDADGTRWYIRTTSGSRERDGIEEVKVRWMHTKEPVEMLSNAQGAIDTFETDLQLAGADEVAQVRQRRVLDIAESHFPRGSVLLQSEEDYAASQRWVSSLWPEIRPHRTLDLYPAIYRIYMELASRRRNKKHGGKSLRCLMKLPQLRPLRWSDDFLNSGASLTCCRRKRASLFIQVTGTELVRPCTRCTHGRLTPFLECVQTAPDQQLWLNGACANCGTQGNLCCDYHGVFVGRTGGSHHPARPRNGSHSTATVLERDRATHTTLDRDDDSSDTSDYDSDDDDDHDDDDAIFDGGQEAATGADTSGSRLWPPFPPNLLTKEFVFDGASTATSPATNRAPGSSQNFGGLSSSSPIRPERGGKLPSAKAIKERLSRNHFGEGSSSYVLAQRVLARQNGKENQSHRNIDADGTSQIQPASSARPKSTGDNYTPQPIEMDLLKLAFKYDHLEPLKHRTSKNGVSASTSTAATAAARVSKHANTAVDQAAQHISVQNKHTLHFSPEPTSPVSKKRPASMPPLHRRRPPQRQAFMKPGNPATPTSVLPSTATTAPPKLTAPEHVARTHSTSAKTFLQIRTLAGIERDAIHTGCNAGQPCRNHRGPAPVPSDPQALVYRDTLIDGRQVSLEEAEYIVSRADCFWARKFTVLWAMWCDDKGGIENEERTQVQWLLSYPELLRNAAEECCPIRPRRRKRPKVPQFAKDPKDIIAIDD